MPSREPTTCALKGVTLDARPRQAGRFLLPDDQPPVWYAAVFLDIPKPTLYRWMQRGELPYEDYGGLIDRHISIEDTMRVKAAKRPGRRKNVTQSV
jgi:hypothetical protein